jgi:hypothetical protein
VGFGFEGFWVLGLRAWVLARLELLVYTAGVLRGALRFLINSYLSKKSIAQQKDAWVVDYLQYQDGITQWDVIFTRLVQD